MRIHISIVTLAVALGCSTAKLRGETLAERRQIVVDCLEWHQMFGVPELAGISPPIFPARHPKVIRVVYGVVGPSLLVCLQGLSACLEYGMGGPRDWTSFRCQLMRYSLLPENEVLWSEDKATVLLDSGLASIRRHQAQVPAPGSLGNDYTATRGWTQIDSFDHDLRSLNEIVNTYRTRSNPEHSSLLTALRSLCTGRDSNAIYTIPHFGPRNSYVEIIVSRGTGPIQIIGATRTEDPSIWHFDPPEELSSPDLDPTRVQTVISMLRRLRREDFSCAVRR